MIQITEYEALGKGRVRVRFGNGTELFLYRTEVKRMKLQGAEAITEEEYELLLGELGKRAAKRAMYLLEQMDRTEQQLREKLAQGNYPPVCIDQAVAYVKRFHYIDDMRYACNYVRSSQEKLSRRQILFKLAQKGVDQDTAERAVEAEYESDEIQQIRRLLEKRNYVSGAGCEKEFRRTYQYLMRRGFHSSDILKEMRREAADYDSAVL